MTFVEPRKFESTGETNSGILKGNEPLHTMRRDRPEVDRIECRSSIDCDDGREHIGTVLPSMRTSAEGFQDLGIVLVETPHRSAPGYFPNVTFTIAMHERR